MPQLPLSLALMLATLCCSPGVRAAATATIDVQNVHQQIDGFGASDAWSIDPAVREWMKEGREEQVELLADYLFSVDHGIGLSAWRFNIGAGSAEQGERSAIPDPLRRAELMVPASGRGVIPGKQAGQIRFLQEARDRGVKTFVAFANSPPFWATKNGLTHPGDGEGVGSTNLAPDKMDAYSEFLVDVLEHLRAAPISVPVNYISPANEPTWHWQGQTQEGNRYNNEDLKQLYRHLDGALSRAGLSHQVEIDGVEAPEYRAALDDDLHKRFSGSVYNAGMNDSGTGSFKNYIDTFLGDEEMRRILGNKLSLHAYFSEADSDRLGRLRDLLGENVKRASPDAKLWMSEYCVLGEAGDVRSFEGQGFDAGDMEVAMHVARIIHRDLTRLNVSAWFWWLALTPYDYKDGLLKVDADFSAESMTATKVMWALGHYSRFIRPGYQRIELRGMDDLSGLMASAFRSPDSRELVVVLVNAGDSSSEPELVIEGLPSGLKAGKPRMFVTNRSSDHLKVSVGSGVSLPAQSIATLVFPLEAAR